MPGITVPSDWGGSELGWGQGLSALGGAMMSWGKILHQDAREDAALKQRQDAAAEAYGKLLQGPGAEGLPDAPPVYGPPEAPTQGPPEPGQIGMTQGPRQAEDPVAALRRQALEGEAVLAANAPDLIDDYRKAAGARIRQAELERDSRLLAPTLSQTRAFLGPDNKAADADLNILVEGLRRGDLTLTQVKAGMQALQQEHTQRLNEAALQDEFGAIVRSLTTDPRFNMWGYNSRSHDEASYQAGAFGNVALLGELRKITDGMPPAARNQFYRAVMGAETQGMAQTLMETQKENNQLKKEREATRVALQKVRDAQAGVTAPGQGAVDAGPPLSAAGQPAPEQPAPGQPAPGAQQAATAGVPWKQWSATNRFKESGMYAKHDNDMYLASAQSELSDAIANIGLEGSEEQRAAAVAKAVQSWSSKHGVRFDSRAEVSEFLSQDVERPPVKERFERVVADALSIASREDIVRRASQAETVEQAVKDVGDRLVAGILAGVGAATDDAEYTAYARERMAEKDTLRRVYDSAAEAVQQAGEQGALDAARWYYRDKNVIRKVVDDLSDYIDNVADGYGALVDTGSERDARRQANVQRTMAGQVRRQQKRHDLLVDERDEALAAQGRAAMRSEDLRVAAEENRGQPSAAEQAAQQLRNKQASVESDIQNLREQVETARGELQAAGLESRATIGRKLRSFMRMRQKYAAMADSGMVDRNVVEALSTEIEQLLKLYRRGPKK